MRKEDELIMRGDALEVEQDSQAQYDRIMAIPAVPHEMTAREFLRDFHRLCQSMGCDECPITHDDEPRTCAVLMGCFPDETIETVEQWAAEHPEKKRKTYAEDFKEKYPKADANWEDGYPRGFCRNPLYGKNNCGDYKNCVACWNEEMEGEDE